LLRDESRRERMGASARQWALSQFDWPRLAEQVAEIMGCGAQPPGENGASAPAAAKRTVQAT
jgi:hypothetical protein